MFYLDAQLVWLNNQTSLDQQAVQLIKRLSGCSTCSTMCPVHQPDILLSKLAVLMLKHAGVAEER